MNFRPKRTAYGQNTHPARNGLAGLVGSIASLREREPVAVALMVSFTVIMRAEFGQCPGQRTLQLHAGSCSLKQRTGNARVVSLRFPRRSSA
jgi:hypothetical protein